MSLRREHNKYESIVFDCDGVLVDSNTIKSDAFEETLEGEDEQAIQVFLNYHAQNGGVPRRVKFEWFYGVYLKRENHSTLVEEALNRFKVILKSRLAKAQLIPGVEDYLKMINSSEKKCFVISAAADDELVWLLKEKSIYRYFDKVLGSGKSKQQHLSDLIDANLINAKSSLFFGDSQADYMAAKFYGLTFVFVSGYSLWADGIQICKNQGVVIVEDFQTVQF